jgi:hypothetical protein
MFLDFHFVHQISYLAEGDQSILHPNTKHKFQVLIQIEQLSQAQEESAVEAEEKLDLVAAAAER